MKEVMGDTEKLKEVMKECNIIRSKRFTNAKANLS